MTRLIQQCKTRPPSNLFAVRCQACLVLFNHSLHLTLRTFRCWHISFQVPNLQLTISRFITTLVDNSLAWQSVIERQKILAHSAIVLCESNSAHLGVWKGICWESEKGWICRYGCLETREDVGFIYRSSLWDIRATAMFNDQTSSNIGCSGNKCHECVGIVLCSPLCSFSFFLSRQSGHCFTKPCKIICSDRHFTAFFCLVWSGRTFSFHWIVEDSVALSAKETDHHCNANILGVGSTVFLLMTLY